MGWLLRLVLLLLLASMLLRAGYRLLEGVIEGATGPRSRRRGGVPSKGTQMVRDPVCGTFVVQSRALTAVRGGQAAWFCSEECRRRWQAGRP
jgi:uncharacterized protein